MTTLKEMCKEAARKIQSMQDCPSDGYAPPPKAAKVIERVVRAYYRKAIAGDTAVETIAASAKKITHVSRGMVVGCSDCATLHHMCNPCLRRYVETVMRATLEKIVADERDV